MIKKGLDTEIIVETLNKIYIEPLVKADQKPHKPGIFRKRHRNQVRQNADHNLELQTGSEYSNGRVSNTARLKILSPLQGICKQAIHIKEEKTPQLVYLCKLPECKSLKIWIRPSDFPAVKG